VTAVLIATRLACRLLCTVLFAVFICAELNVVHI